MSEELKKQLETALGELRSTHEDVKKLKAEGKGHSELLEKMEKANKDLDSLETKNQEMMSNMEAERKSRETMEATIKEMEAKMAKLASAPAGNAREQKEIAMEAEVKNLRLFAEGRKKGIEEKYLRTDSNEEGGFLMRDSVDDVIIKPITEISALRQYCRVKKVDGALIGAARETLVDSYWTGEGDEFEESNSTYRSPKIPVHSLTTFSKSTNRALQEAAWDLESEITGDMIESRAKKEGAAFVNGDGVSKPTGILSSGLSELESTSGTTAEIDFDDLIKVTGELKDGYDPMYGFNRKTLAFIRTLTDPSGRYIWQAGNLGAGVPNQINGYNYIVIPDMPNLAAASLSVIFADFKKLYTIVDAFNMIFLRNPYKTRGHVEYSTEGWVGGQVVLKEAGILIKTDS
jgi:HK97 family phage major capsid protein